jgi:hypothetical protein
MSLSDQAFSVAPRNPHWEYTRKLPRLQNLHLRSRQSKRRSRLPKKKSRRSEPNAAEQKLRSELVARCTRNVRRGGKPHAWRGNSRSSNRKSVGSSRASWPSAAMVTNLVVEQASSSETRPLPLVGGFPALSAEPPTANGVTSPQRKNRQCAEQRLSR